MEADSTVLRLTPDHGASAMLTELLRARPRPVYDDIKMVVLSLLTLRGADEAYQLLDGKTVAAALAEFPQYHRPQPTVTGEIDGLRYALFDPPQ